MSRSLTACRCPFALCRPSGRGWHSAVRLQAWPRRKGADGRDLSPSARGFLHSLNTALEGPHMPWHVLAGLVPDDTVAPCAPRYPGQQALEVGRNTDMHQVKGEGASIVRPLSGRGIRSSVISSPLHVNMRWPHATPGGTCSLLKRDSNRYARSAINLSHSRYLSSSPFAER